MMPAFSAWMQAMSSGVMQAGLAALIAALLVVVAILVWRNHSLRRLAAIDVLTGLSNRMLLDALLDREVARAARQDRPLCIAMVDLDHFKHVNDRFGHLEGDRVLAAVAHVLLNGVRASDVVGRWGGEEFLVILPDTGLAEATRVVERLRHQLADLRLPRVGTVTVSAGVAEYAPGDEPTSLVDRADGALYHAKNTGRNRTCLASVVRTTVTA